MCLPLKRLHTNPKRDFLFSLFKNTHKIYIKMRNTQENWIIIAKHGNHFLTALHNQLVNKFWISMIETLGAASRREYFNLNLGWMCCILFIFVFLCASGLIDQSFGMKHLLLYLLNQSCFFILCFGFSFDVLVIQLVQVTLRLIWLDLCIEPNCVTKKMLV